MFSNFRYPVILFILAFIGMMLGILFKILNWPGAQLTQGSMIMVQLIAIVWLTVILFREGGG